MASEHVPVMCDQVVALLAPAGPGLLVDCTVGLGGHAAALLQAAPGLRLLGLDRDPAALSRAGERLGSFGGRVELVESTFDRLPELLAARCAPPPVALLADLGCSSLQLDSAPRGFSFQADGPLDMRMGASGRTAAELVAEASLEELVTVLRDYGEERRARVIARAIVNRRGERPVTTTGELAAVVRQVLGHPAGQRIHPATRTFQALRIAVNDELGQIERLVEPAMRALSIGGRAVFISFHSLEDRLVKHTLRRLEGRCACPPGLPECRCRPERLVRELVRGALRPEADEVAMNPRARSARLRAVIREAAG